MQNLRLKYGQNELPIQDGYTIVKSSKEVSYSDLICGWDDNINELPERYQEVQIVNIDNNKVNAFGYVDTYNFGKLRETDVERDITFSLFSPYKLATLRTTVAYGIYRIKDLIQNYLLLPLINDGFNIERLDITDRTVTVNYNLETVEFCMNSLSGKYDFWWYIDEQKKIYVVDINTLLVAEPKYRYDNQNRIKGLQYILPITQSDGYANVINFKNVRIYEYSEFHARGNHYPLINNSAVSLSKGDEITFNYPIDITPDNVLKSKEDRHYNSYKTIAQNGKIYSDKSGGYIIYFDYLLGSTGGYALYHVNSDGTTNISDNLSIDKENKNTDFVLITDSFFSNLVTGIRYNGDSKVTTILQMSAEGALIWQNVKFINDTEVAKKINKISNSGIVETTIDLNGAWKTTTELTEIAQSYFGKNSLNYADEIELKTDEDLLKVGDSILINKFGINGAYFVVSITEVEKDMDIDYVVQLCSSNNLQNFVDVFRSETSQEPEDKQVELYVEHYTNATVENIVEVIQ